MDKELLNGFEPAEERGKIKRSITIDWELDLELKKLQDEKKVNVSELINQFLWYWLNKQKRDNKDKKEVK